MKKTIKIESESEEDEDEDSDAGSDDISKLESIKMDSNTFLDLKIKIV